MGIAKSILAFGIWYRSWLIRRIAIIFLTLFAVFGIVVLLTRFTWLELATVVADILILLYIWKILPKYMRYQVTDPVQ